MDTERRSAPRTSTVPSPCIGVCRMVPATGLCEGCLRTIDEIVAWDTADDAYRQAVWDQIRRREARSPAP